MTVLALYSTLGPTVPLNERRQLDAGSMGRLCWLGRPCHRLLALARTTRFRHAATVACEVVCQARFTDERRVTVDSIASRITRYDPTLWGNIVFSQKTGVTEDR